MGKRTSLVVANQTATLRTTVPGHIVEHFGLRDGDQLEWNLKAEGGTITIGVVPVKMDPEQRDKKMARRAKQAEKRRAAFARKSG